ncbi:MAG: asparagine synthase (glutamine-hydrolyzing) [Sedimentisphaerales bacterium]|nr:asparagine synthase (glutamine-hydrolyzing) [Sedimentisphaerales bacterium]
MCGIAGIYSLKNKGRVELDSMKSMAGLLRHRGPDEAGFYMGDGIGLAHTRLSIIDLSSGTQPIHNEDQSMWIIYNGEVFNYPELRQGLESKGHRFYTTSDTEVLLHLYEQYGLDCLEQLNGQFAFAIWDSAKRELFAARDHVGILPFYFTIVDDTLIFASEIKAIFANQNVTRRLDPLAMDQIFTFWTTLKGRTAFEGINELPPGHFLKVSNGKLEVRKYWDVPFVPRCEQLDTPTDEICENIRGLLLDAVRIRFLRADVPVGAYLSGGLDSSGITAVIVQNFDRDVTTFGIRFEESAFDEGCHQNQMAEFLKTRHSEIQATNEQIGACFADCLWHCEKPLLRTAPAPMFLLSKFVREHNLKVVLTGEGADEFFGGYDVFRETKVRKFLARFPGSRKRAALTGQLYSHIFRDRARVKQSLPMFFGKGLESLSDPLFSHLLRWENTGRIKVFFSDELKQAIGGYDGFAETRESLPADFGQWDCVSRAQYLETVIFLSNYLLSSQGDRMAMANSLEIRPPYLDKRIIEYMSRVPARWKILGMNEKFILKKAYKGIIPDDITSRTKHPYRAPIKNSLLAGQAGVVAREMLSENAIKKAGLFDAKKVALLVRKLEKAEEGSEVDNMALAGILSSQIIYEQFIEGFSTRLARLPSVNLLVDRRTDSAARAN